MIKTLLPLLLLTVFMISVAAEAEENHCPELLKNEDDLDRVYELSGLVFVARIEPRNSINPQIFNFRRFDPVLKGEVPEQGYLTFADHCRPMTSDAIYLFMLNSLDEKVEGYNAIFLSLPDGGPGFNWIADWIDAKVSEH